MPYVNAVEQHPFKIGDILVGTREGRLERGYSITNEHSVVQVLSYDPNIPMMFVRTIAHATNTEWIWSEDWVDPKYFKLSGLTGLAKFIALQEEISAK